MSMNILLCVCLLAFIVTACSFINKKLGLPDDNPVEESVEKILKEKLNVDVDLTPENKENP